MPLCCEARVEQLPFALAQILEKRLAVNWPHAPALDVFVATIQDAADFGNFSETSCYGVSHKLVGRATALGKLFIQSRFRFRLKMHFHSCQCKDASSLLSKSIARRVGENWRC